MNHYIKVFNKKRAVYKLVIELRCAVMEDGDLYCYFRSRKFYCALSLKKIIDDYPQIDLFLCHQSRLVNENYISETVDFNPEMITLENGMELDVSYRIKEEMKPLHFINWLQYLNFFRLKVK